MERLTFKAGGFNAFNNECLSTYGGIQKNAENGRKGRMRLIDADKFKECFNTDTAIGKTMRLMIDEQPTAYDVEKLEDFRQDETVMKSMDTIKRYCASRECNSCVILDDCGCCMFRDGCQAPRFWETSIEEGAVMRSSGQEQLLEQKRQKLEEAVYSVHEWICKYGDPYTTVEVSQDRVVVNEEHMSIPLSVPD